MRKPRWNDGRRFAGRVAVVTGAGGTLGGATARALAREGAAVAVGYRSSIDAAERVVADIEAGGGSAHLAPLDVTDQDAVDAFVDGVCQRHGGRIDVLVNAAGRLDAADTVRFSELDPAAATTLLEVDVVGTMRMCHAVAPHMREAGGAIVNFSSTYGNGIDPDNPINFVPVTYCAAKGAVRGLTASLARDLAPNIRVNALAPGPIEGNWEGEWGISPAQVEQAIAMTPLKRFGVPAEIAETALFLASDGAGYVTGQVIHVDAGWVLDG
jgi:3-oxoacyl-[acyl-carrier protein] reductase